VQGRPLWTADLSWVLPYNERLAQLEYWLEALEGFRGSVQLWDFEHPYPTGLTITGSFSDTGRTANWSGTGGATVFGFAGRRSRWRYAPVLTISSGVAINLKTVPVTGCQANKIAAFQGQHVQIGRRIYVVESTVKADGSGAAALTLLTGLLSAASSGDSVRVVEAACEMHLVDQEWSKSGQAGQAFRSVRARFRETVTDYAA
jgi:hypothetical protein